MSLPSDVFIIRCLGAGLFGFTLLGTPWASWIWMSVYQVRDVFSYDFFKYDFRPPSPLGALSRQYRSVRRCPTSPADLLHFLSRFSFCFSGRIPPPRLQVERPFLPPRPVGCWNPAVRSRLSYCTLRLCGSHLAPVCPISLWKVSLCQPLFVLLQ